MRKLFPIKRLKTLAIIGSNGMLGLDLVEYLSPYFSVTSISKDNYSQYVHTIFDVVLNANGNSKRFWANQNPREDFIASTASAYYSIFDFPSDLYIYISSPDVYEHHTSPDHTKENQEIDPKNLQSYGFNKYLAELIVKKHKEKFLILRCSMILGKNLKKGPFYDVIHNNPLFVTSETRLQLIATHAIAEIVKILLRKSVCNEVLNIGGIGAFSFTKIKDVFNKEVKISPKAETQIYEMNIGRIKHLYPNLKTSEEYLREFLKDN